MKIKKLELDRYSLPNLLGRADLIGIELGVASGDFSSRLVQTKKFAQLFGVDAYADHHDTAEYIATLTRIGISSPYHLIRARFDEALPLFPNSFFDFVYIDGYAHTGQDDGRTIFSWLPKVKIGGVLAGHDYHEDWPLVVAAVDDLCNAAGFELLVTQMSSNPGPQDQYPSWAVIKRHDAVARRMRGPTSRVSSASAINRQAVVSQAFWSRVREAGKVLIGASYTERLRHWRSMLLGR